MKRSTIKQMQSIEEALRKTQRNVMTPRTLLRKKQDEYQVAYFSPGVEKVILGEKIQKLLVKTMQRLKLNKVGAAEKFNTRFFGEARTLRTFHDAEHELKRINIYNDQTKLTQVVGLKNTKKTSQITDDTIDSQDNCLLSELNREKQDIFQQQGFPSLDLIKINEKLGSIKNKSSLIDPQKYQKSIEILEKSGRLLVSGQHTKNYKSAHQSEIIDSMEYQGSQTQRNTDNQFFSSINKQMDSPGFIFGGKRGRVQEEDSLKSPTNVLNIVKVLQRTYGININQEHMGLHGDILEAYKKNSQKVLQSVRTSTEREFSKFAKEQTETTQTLTAARIQRKSDAESLKFKGQVQIRSQYSQPQSHHKKQTKSELMWLEQQELQNQRYAWRLERVQQFQNLKCVVVEQSKMGIFSQLPKPSEPISMQMKRIKNYFGQKSEAMRLKNTVSDFIVNVQQTEDQFTSDRQVEDDRILELGGAIERVQERYGFDQELSSTTSPQHDPILQLRNKLKQNIKKLQKKPLM